MNTPYLGDPAVKTTIPAPAPPPDIEIRYKYNQDFESIYTMVPISISLLLALFPAILTALSMFLLKSSKTQNAANSVGD
jgi:ribosome-dependent ATPase